MDIDRLITADMAATAVTVDFPFPFQLWFQVAAIEEFQFIVTIDMKIMDMEKELMERDMVMGHVIVALITADSSDKLYLETVRYFICLW